MQKRPSDAQPSGGKKVKKQKRTFDFSRFAQRKVAMKLSYVGFLVPQGFVQQAPEDGTVEDLLFQAVVKCCLNSSKEACGYSRCGRTDKGVSAQGNVIAMMVRSNAKAGEPLPAADSELDYTLLLNRVLPEGIQITQHALVALDFDARFDCSWRYYRYFFQRANLDLKAMKEACADLVGPHDYRNLCTHDVSNVTHFNREILQAAIVETSMQARDDPQYQTCYFEVRGTAFLYHQVRCMMALLFMVGHKQEPPSLISQMLNVETHPRKPQYVPASDAPLVLYDTGYPDDKVQWLPRTADSEAKLADRSHGLWARHMLQSAALFGLVEPFGVPQILPKHIGMWSRNLEDPVELKFENFRKKQEKKQKNLDRAAQENPVASAAPPEK
eukprot:TRINITY_DN24531_c0_g2_i5.p1 TRINITY_DN24531_c0_g2~~TRINITY_DN24531_c0_g2_i5.p1  ORF type:complete len:385 (-),score=80.03 TRINITY_DN24531_c0_g2_i5:192-1346(-)